jgi:hypothetical protein
MIATKEKSAATLILPRINLVATLVTTEKVSVKHLISIIEKLSAT